MASWCRGDDSGQMALGLILLVMVLMLLFAVRVLLPFGQATDQKASSRGAADAAALAAAQQIQADMPDALEDAVDAAQSTNDLLDLMDAFEAGYGRQAASEYAERNDADLIGYRYSRSDGEVQVRVRYQAAAENGDHAESDATADLGLRLGTCTLPSNSEPTPTATRGDDGKKPGRPSDTVVTVTCGDLELKFTVNGTSGKPTLKTDLGLSFDDLEPRLVS